MAIIKVTFKALLFLLLCKIFLFDVYTVSKLSMSPQLAEGKIVVAEKISVGLHFSWPLFFSSNSPQKEIYFTHPLRRFRVGDVLIFHSPLTIADPWIKKVEAVEGDVLFKRDNKIWRGDTFLFAVSEVDDSVFANLAKGPKANRDFFDFLLAQEKNSLKSKAQENDNTDTIKAFVVPVDYLLLLGANKKKSIDSRNFGLIDRQTIIGRVVYDSFPLSASLR